MSRYNQRNISIRLALVLATGFLLIIIYVGNQRSFSMSSEPPPRFVRASIRNTSSTNTSPTFLATRRLYKDWKTCIDPLLASNKNNAINLWTEIGGIISKCGRPLMEKIKAEGFTNSNETLYHIMPKNGQRETVVISLGVGQDIGAEEKLKMALGNNSLEFFGADPIVEINQKLYETIGQFFPFAISAVAGVMRASVLIGKEYVEKQVINIDAIYFLQNFVKRSFVDNLFLDTETAEYGLFPFFYKGGLFDENNFTFCQINMEIHTPSEMQKEWIRDFLFTLIEDEKYAFVNPVNGHHLRIFLINFDDSKCVEKYLSNSQL